MAFTPRCPTCRATVASGREPAPAVLLRALSAGGPRRVVHRAVPNRRRAGGARVAGRRRRRRYARERFRVIHETAVVAAGAEVHPTRDDRALRRDRGGVRISAGRTSWRTRCCAVPPRSASATSCIPAPCSAASRRTWRSPAPRRSSGSATATSFASTSRCIAGPSPAAPR